jgi:ABC-type uncharacterized transport system ATPase subunit
MDMFTIKAKTLQVSPSIRSRKRESGESSRFQVSSLQNLGEKQWLEIGMALAGRPNLLLLDEPTGGMTLGETRATIDLIKKISTDFHISILVIEHDISFVREIESQVTVMYKGQIINEGTFEEIQKDKTVREIYLGRGD